MLVDTIGFKNVVEKKKKKKGNICTATNYSHYTHTLSHFALTTTLTISN